MRDARDIIANHLCDPQDRRARKDGKPCAEHYEEADAILTALSSAGLAVVPVEPTSKMLNAAIDVDSLKLGYIAPLGFRCSPQQLFDKCYRAMIAAALPPLASGGG